MKLRSALAFTILLGAGTASAGGLLLPGAGPESTARAGASTVASEDGEALALNPANLAKTKGTVITFGFAAIDYFMSFQRNGTYDTLPTESTSYAGMPYPTIENDVKPPLGIPGTGFQPVPVIAITSDLGGKVPGLVAAFGLYAPNAYPFRDMNKVNGQPYFTVDKDGSYDFPTFGSPPPSTRYDVIHQEAAIILPSVAVGYRVIPQLDVGARFSAGFAQLKSAAALWGVPGNYQENIKQDGIVTINASDSFVPEFALGATFHATDNIELAARYTSELDVHAKGDAESHNGPMVNLNGQPIEILPRTGTAAICADGGTMEKQKACIDLALPMTATVGGRYKFLDTSGREKGDLELDIDWENWGASRASDYQIVIDGVVATPNMPMNGIDLKPQLIKHGFKDTYAARLGGSWVFPTGSGSVVARGGLSYDTAAAKTGWERTDIDGAARTTIAAGASYKTTAWTFDAGFGVILEGTRTDPRTCNPTASMQGCAGTPGYSGGTPGMDNPVGQRQGPDPINPIIVSNVQAENPTNAGTYKSHYVMFMLGASYRF
jgi:long-chain fatty acid transport protein